jgi:putative redox protein
MSLTASARSTPGKLRQEVLIDGRFRLTTDEPEQLGGDDSGPAPHELFPAAVAACISTTLVRYARTKDWDLGQVTVDVDYDHRSTPRRFSVAIELTGELDDEQLARLEQVAAACPVRRSVESGIVFEERLARAADRGEPVGAGGTRSWHEAGSAIGAGSASDAAARPVAGR